MFPEACREDRLRAGLRMFSEAPVASLLRVRCFAPELCVRTCRYRAQARRKTRYHNIRQARVRLGAHVRARCRARCRCGRPVPRAPIRTYPDACVYVRTYFRECVRAHVRLDGRCRRRLASSSGAIALAEATRQRGAGQGCFRRHAPCAADNGECSRAHREKFGAGHDK